MEPLTITNIIKRKFYYLAFAVIILAIFCDMAGKTFYSNALQKRILARQEIPQAEIFQQQSELYYSIGTKLGLSGLLLAVLFIILVLISRFKKETTSLVLPAALLAMYILLQFVCV